MKKIYQLEDLDCAVCAQKIETSIKKIDSVIDVSVSFISQKMVIDFDDNADIEAVMNNIVKLCKKIEPDCIIKR